MHDTGATSPGVVLLPLQAGKSGVSGRNSESSPRIAQAPGGRDARHHFYAAERHKNGGRDRDRTCDPFHVKEVLFR